MNQWFFAFDFAFTLPGLNAGESGQVIAKQKFNVITACPESFPEKLLIYS
jgi:hypothetical protein